MDEELRIIQACQIVWGQLLKNVDKWSLTICKGWNVLCILGNSNEAGLIGQK